MLVFYHEFARFAPGAAISCEGTDAARPPVAARLL